MKLSHIAVGVLVAAIWGFNFVTIRLSLDSFPPLLLTALRFLLAALPAFFISKPDLSWRTIILIAIPLFLVQFVFLFTGMKLGMPAGMASVTFQLQAFFTIIIAVFLLKEKPSLRQIIGCLIALSGLGCIAATVGGDVTVLGLLFTISGALSWATGNVLLRKYPANNIFAMIVWMSVVIPLPALLLSLLFEGPTVIAYAFTHASFISVVSLVYVSIISTLLGFGLWSYLMRQYPAATVAPFSLLVPIFGMVSAWLVFSEHFQPMRLLGAALILAGLAVIVLRKPAPVLSD